MEAGMVITITRLKDVIGSANNGSLSKHSSTKQTTKAVIK